TLNSTRNNCWKKRRRDQTKQAKPQKKTTDCSCNQWFFIVLKEVTYSADALPPSSSSCHFFNSSNLPSAASLACSGHVSVTAVLNCSPASTNNALLASADLPASSA